MMYALILTDSTAYGPDYRPKLRGALLTAGFDNVFVLHTEDDDYRGVLKKNSNYRMVIMETANFGDMQIVHSKIILRTHPLLIIPGVIKDRNKLDDLLLTSPYVEAMPSAERLRINRSQTDIDQLIAKKAIVLANAYEPATPKLPFPGL